MQRKKTNASQYQQNKYVYNYLCICICIYTWLCVCVCENQLDPNTPSSLHCYAAKKVRIMIKKKRKKK